MTATKARAMSNTIATTLCLFLTSAQVSVVRAEGGCIYDGDKIASVDTVMRQVGTQCVEPTEDGGVSRSFYGEEDVCVSSDGTVEHNKLSEPIECPEGTFCDMCGPPRRGAAQCVEESFESRGISCDFPTTYKSQGCFTFDLNNTVVPVGTTIGGQSTVIGCDGNNRLKERYIMCNEHWNREFVDESVSCPGTMPRCVETLGTASCEAESLDDVKTYVTTDAATGSTGSTTTGGSEASTNAIQEDGCVKGNILIEPGDIFKQERYECLSDTSVATLVQTCQSGGGIIGMTQDLQCPQGIKPTCYQCGSSIAQCLNPESDTIPEGCVRGSVYVAGNNIGGGSGGSTDSKNEGDDTKDTSSSSGSGGTNGSNTGGGSGTAASIGEIRCIDYETGKSFGVGEEMARIGFKCTGGSFVEGKIIKCGSDGNPTKDSALKAFDCPNGQPCYQCGFSAAPGAAICADNVAQAQARSLDDLVTCQIAGAFDQTSASNNDNDGNTNKNVGSSAFTVFGNEAMRYALALGSIVAAMFMM